MNLAGKCRPVGRRWTHNTARNPEKYMLPLYQRPPIVFSHGKGCKLFDEEGRAYLDFMAGIAVNALGHADGELVATVAQQAGRLMHLGNYYHHAHASKLAEQLVKPLQERRGNARWDSTTQSPSVFFGNSGTEANEAAIKFCRKWGRAAAPDGRKHGLVSFNHAFHGRTMGALSATPTPKYQDPFKPLVPGFRHGTFNDASALEALIDETTCGVLLEPVQGEGGVFPATPEFLAAVRARADAVGALVVYDEIQCGLGRTGALYAHFNYPVEASPDLVTLAKPLANGIPIGATVVSGRVAAEIKPGDHGTTFGGNALACAAGNVVVRRLSDPSFLASVRDRGAHLGRLLAQLQKRFPHVVLGVRGRGLLLGVQFPADFALDRLVRAALDERLLLITAGQQTLRLTPPLVITDAELTEGVSRLERALVAIGC